MKKKSTLTNKTAEELVKILGEKREELRKLRFEAAGARPKDVNAPRKVRRDIARIHTEMRRSTLSNAH
ncbi:MAG: 50S ribosomal protein L29 [Minisyncoccia bacterium]